MSPRALALIVFGFLSAVVLTFFVIRIQPIKPPVRKTTPSTTITVTEPSVTFVNPTRGATAPTVTIIEYSDFECLYCREFATAVETALRTYPKEIRHVWKNLPDENAHPLAVPSAIAAFCAAKEGKFWEYHDQLFARQGYLSKDQFPQIAQELGLDVERFQACFDAQETLPIIERDYEEAMALKITSTPTVYVNGVQYVGAITAEELMQYVEKARLGQ